MMAVVAIISMMLAMALPYFVRMKITVTETTAVTSFLRSLKALFDDYQFAKGTYPAAETVKDDLAEFANIYYAKSSLADLTAQWASHGYLYDCYMTGVANWKCLAVPEIPGVTGENSFAIDESGSITQYAAAFGGGGGGGGGGSSSPPPPDPEEQPGPPNKAME